MLLSILVILVILWFLGYLHLDNLPIPHITFFTINSHPITLWDILIFIVVTWAVGVLPSPFRQIGAVMLVLWVLSTLGIIAFAGFSSILIIAIIVGIVFYMIGEK